MTPTPLRRALALAFSLVLGVGMALLAAPAVHADPSDDATLGSLSVSAGTFDEPFDPAGTISQVSVPYDTGWFSFTPTSNDPGATITTWNGSVESTTASGTPTANSWLAAGLNTMTAMVTAPNGVTQKQYTLFVVKADPPAPLYDLDLSGLAVSEGALSPAFATNVTTYYVDVPYTTNSMTVTPVAVDPGNSVTVKNAGSGAPGPSVFLGVGNTTVLITVTAPDDTSNVYTIHVTRGPVPTADVDLSGIQLSAGTLSPSFDPAVQAYTATVPYAVRSMQIGATASVSDNTVTVNNAPIVDGVPVTVSLNFDPIGSGFGIRVTADNGVEKIYTVTITRDQPSNDADLTSLSLTEGTLSPAFSNAETAYTATVPYLTTSTAVTSTVADATAILRVDGHDTASGAVSAPIDLEVGANTITVAATAEDTVTTTTRTIVITREAPDLDLSTLTVAGGTLSPSFDADTTEYALALPYPVASVDVAASAVESDWTLEIQGTETDDTTVAVPVGVSTITVTVTALYGESRDYTIAVTRDAPSADATLSGITLSDATLSPVFSPDTTDYTATVGYLTEQVEVEALVADATASMTINGEDTTSAVLPLVVGENTVTVVTIAQDGFTTITTTIVVTRQAASSPDIDFDLGFKAGDAAVDAPFTVSAANLLPGSIATVTMHSAPVVLVTGTVLDDGTVALGAHLPANVEPGAHRLVFEGTAMDGTPVTATAWFTALRDGTVGAVSLTGPVAYVEPAALADTGADSVVAVATGVSLATIGALLFVLGGVLRRRRSIA